MLILKLRRGTFPREGERIAQLSSLVEKLFLILFKCLSSINFQNIWNLCYKDLCRGSVAKLLLLGPVMVALMGRCTWHQGTTEALLCDLGKRGECQGSRALWGHPQKGARGGCSGQWGQDGSAAGAGAGAGSRPPARGCGRGGGGGRLCRWPGSPAVPAAAVTSAGSAPAVAGHSGATLPRQTLQ